MDLGLIVLRLAHVVAGVAWAGGAFIMVLVVQRTARLSGAVGDEFIGRLMSIGRGSSYFGALSLITVLAGGLLYWRMSAGLQWGWISSPNGVALTIGAIAALVSFVLGGAIVGPTGGRLEAIGAEIHAAGAPPTTAQLTAIDGLKRRLDTVAKVDLALLAVAVITMAVARYL